MKSLRRPKQSAPSYRFKHKPKGPVIANPTFLLMVVFTVALCSVTAMGKILVSLEKRYITKLSELLRGGVTLVECRVTTPSDPHVNSTTAANGPLEITVRNDLSPIAASVFLDLVNANYYDGCYIFRVLKGFVAQWGYRSHWEWSSDTITKPPKARDHITDETLSNTRGTMSFAAGNPWLLQVFVNLNDNIRLDKDKTRPFATLSDGSMKVLDRLYMEYKDNEGQIQAMKQGDFLEKFPMSSRIETCQVVTSFTSETSVPLLPL